MDPNLVSLVNEFSIFTERMKCNPIRNYVTPGLTSWLIGGKNKGVVRMFTCDRDTKEFITPHSHRFDFLCLVLKGEVINTVYTHAVDKSLMVPRWNYWAVGMLEHKGDGVGSYIFNPGVEPVRFMQTSTKYEVGDIYTMTLDQIHSIEFSKHSQVLFFESGEETKTSVVLEPWSDGARVPTFKVHDWMFKREDK